MSIASAISPHLPFLRRYARALTGDQSSGDNYVAATLEAIVADPKSFGEPADMRTALYAAFSRIWQSIPLNMRGEAPSPSWEQSARRHLSSLPPKSRQAFLLMTVEGFTTPQTAEVLGVSEHDVPRLIDEASRTIMEQVATDVLVIEDEPIIAMDLEAVLEGLGHRVIGVARTESEALQIASQKRPGLILADIQLADGSSGIDAVNKVLRNYEIPVIFITAFPERLLTGEKPEPAFLITKPFVPEMVKAIVSQALFFDTKSRAAA